LVTITIFAHANCCCRCWNDNSPDTNGGIVKSDWAAVDWNKINYLRRLGLKPWYA
jgi:hypothetical protein